MTRLLKCGLGMRTKKTAFSVFCLVQFYSIMHPLSSLQPVFTKIAKLQLPAQFFVRIYVLGWYTYFEAAQLLFAFCFREKGAHNSDNSSMTYVRDLFYVFIFHLPHKELLYVFLNKTEIFSMLH